MAEDPDNIARLDEERRRRSGSGGAGGAADDKLVLNPRYPDKIAGRFLAAAYTDAAGRHTLAHHLGLFYRWEGTCWEPAEPDQLRAALYAWLRPAWRPTTKGDLEEFNASRNNIADILDALAGRVQLAGRVTPPAWLDEKPADVDAGDIIACRNVLLHIPSESRLLHTPSLFTLNAVDFDFDPSAACPRWLAFLEEVLPDDAEAIDQLQKIAGYLLTPDTRQQKAFLLLGPKRSRRQRRRCHGHYRPQWRRVPGDGRGRAARRLEPAASAAISSGRARARRQQLPARRNEAGLVSSGNPSA